MKTLTITALERCRGGHHYTVTVEVDGVPQRVSFDSGELETRLAQKLDLRDIILPLVMDEIGAVRKVKEEDGGKQATLDDEKTAVEGREIVVHVDLKDAAALTAEAEAAEVRR